MENQPQLPGLPDPYVELLEKVKEGNHQILTENKALREAVASRNEALARLEAKVLSLQTTNLHGQNYQCRRRRAVRERVRVQIPPLCRRESRKSYKTLMGKPDFTGYDFDETFESEHNRGISERTIGDVVHRNGGENCAWTKAMMEGALQRYFLSLSEKDKKQRSQTYEAHQRKCRKQGRRREKLSRRTAALEMVSGWDVHNKGQAAEVLLEDAMSSEESEFEEDEGGRRKLIGYKVKRSAWESSKLKKIKGKLDRAYRRSLTRRALDRVLPRTIGDTLSDREPPNEIPQWGISTDYLNNH